MNGLGFTVAGIVLIAFLCIQAIIGGILTPETRGMTLDQIVKKQYGEEA
jgi:inositol transporter-like SP family MFS transporter